MGEFKALFCETLYQYEVRPNENYADIEAVG